MQEEIEVVAVMLEKAKEHSLEAEVVLAFGKLMREGDDLDMACLNALNEWDL